MPQYSRNRAGTIVHEPGCPTRGQKIPWLWAEPLSTRQVAQALIDAGVADQIKPCNVCLFDLSWSYAVADHSGEVLVVGPTS